MTGKMFVVASALWLLGTVPGEAKAVGSCNTVGGCRDLARACGRTDGHTYKPAGEASGVCDDGKASKAGAATAGALTAQTGPTGKSFCTTKALCDNLKKTCSGTYRPLTPQSGECSK